MKQEDAWIALPILYCLMRVELWFVPLVQYRAWGLQYKKVILELDSATIADAFSNCELVTPHLHAILMGWITRHCRTFSYMIDRKSFRIV